MPPRKAPPKGTVVRRVIKKVVTEEVIEEILETPTSHKPFAKSTPTKRTIKTTAAPHTPTAKQKKTPVKAKAGPKMKSALSAGKRTTTGGNVKTSATVKAADENEPVKKLLTKQVFKKEPQVQRKRQNAPKEMRKNITVKDDKTLAVKPGIAKSRTQKTPKKPVAKKTAAKEITTSAKSPSAKRETAVLPTSSSATGSSTATNTSRTKRQTARNSTGTTASAVLAAQSCAIAQNAAPPMPRARFVKQTARKSSGGQVPTVAMQNLQPAAPMLSARRTKQTARKSTDGQVPMQSVAPMPSAKFVKRTARKSSGGKIPTDERQVWQIAAPMPTAKRMKQTARKSSGSKTLAGAARQRQGGAPLPSAKRTKRTAPKSGPTAGGSSTLSRPNTRQTAQHGSYVWELSYETGYAADGFHSYTEPTKRNLGTFTTREAAVRKGQKVVGSDVGFSWEEVKDAGDLETIADTDTRWEICWSPPDSEYAQLVARRIAVSAGRWVVDVDQGYPDDGFHSYSEGRKKQLWPYTIRAQAIGIAKKQVGIIYGIGWDEVVEGGDLEVRAENSEKWEVSWTPPDSEHSHIIVRMLPAPQVGEAVSSAEENSVRSESESSERYESDGESYFGLRF